MSLALSFSVGIAVTLLLNQLIGWHRAGWLNFTCAMIFFCATGNWFVLVLALVMGNELARAS